jgi:hypothetical protein
MKTISRIFRKEQEDVILSDHSLLINVTIGVFMLILTVCMLQEVNII